VRRWGLRIGLAFLWGPILLLVAYAFSADRIPFQWGGFSIRWFGALAANERLLEAAWLSLRIAVGAATLATLLGGLAGWAMVRAGAFRGRALFGVLAGTPLVLPEVVTGLSLLLLFVVLGDALGWPAERGALTVLLAHATIGMAYVAVVVQARLAGQGREMEEAAASLGATRFETFRRVLFPALWPALVTGFTLAFARAIGEYGSVVFISGNMPMKTEIAPLLIVTQLEQYDYAGATAIAAVLLVISFGLLLGINALQRLGARRLAGATEAA